MPIIRAAADGLLSILLAPSCASCGRPLERATQSAVCDSCWNAIRPLAPPLCTVCGDPLPSWRAPGDGSRCPRCREQQTCISGGRSIGEYDGVLRTLVHALKYDGRRSLAPPLSRLMRRHGSDVLAGADLAVPVPLHWRRRWHRGFNQALALSHDLGLPVRQALRRCRHTPSQADLPADQRDANVRNAFRTTRGTCLSGLVIVLIDDVRTTGKTLEECANVVMAAGAREVRTLTAARVVTRLPAGRPR